MENDCQLKVLMVDDHVENLVALEAILEDMEIELVRAQSGREALRHVLEEDFALILLDVRMPDIDGFETARLIRSRDRSRHTPIIFLTAIANETEMIFKGYKTGAVDYIFKPFVPEVLRSKVAVFVDLCRKTGELKRINERLEELVEERTAELLRAEERYRDIFEGAIEGIFQTDAQGRYQIANPALAKILGYASSAELKDSIQSVDQQVYADEALRAEFHRRIGKEGTVSHFESPARRKDGSIIWISENTRAMRDGSGAVVGFEGMVQDVTERREKDAEIAAKNRELKTLLYVTSHDLREPLRAIAGYSELLLNEHHQENLDQEGRDFLNRIVAAAKRMENLLDDIQTLVRAQRMKGPHEEIEGLAIVKEALSMLETKLEKTGAKIQIGENLPLLRLDRTWATHALFNLVSNAIKFTNNGEVPTVEIDGCCFDEEPRQAGFVVRDRGPGVNPSHAERIFQLFRREVGREIEGTGAGLAIVKQIAESHGGRTWVQNRDGGGAEFFITFKC